ncbi:hypothetical protein HZS61_001674 [Fusarium oxysporum f. sp. conglutinans]|uniref:Uncharacterized protein n=1 Tax=Fusarium oxysporum f. sp. conglutinans TaxID=100902 RepID=A0A8H6H740_FUSOX|nr:hypothetical protein HZS61_001674 [Fusarium oxysporum f. sp. conglutinans]
MGMAPLNLVDPVVGSATAALVFTTVSHIVAAAFYRAESNTIGFYPLLTPLLLTVQTYFQPSISSDPVPTSPLISTIKGTTLVAVLSVFSLSNGDLFGSLISIILVACLFIIYSIFSPDFKVRILPLSSVDLETNIKAIAGRTIVILLAALAFQSFILGPPNSNIILVLFTGLVKALSWFFTVQAVRQTSWCIATTIGTFALACTRNPFSQNSQLQALDHLSESDLCKRPEYKDIHGAFISPKTFRLIEGLAPVLSTGAFSTMGDILFPSPAYVEEEFQYDKTHDVPWSKKKNNLYWTGSTTGGYALDDQWRNHQRQRFVALAQNLGHQEHTYLREKDGLISSVKSWFLNGRLYDVGFTRIFQCDRKFCRNQSTFFNVKSWADKDAAFHSKLAFDLDGNGISGRYYKLLSSNTLPLKQALLREWHDERIRRGKGLEADLLCLEEQENL